jgi:phosphatidylglycerophosphate synthase
LFRSAEKRLNAVTTAEQFQDRQIKRKSKNQKLLCSFVLQTGADVQRTSFYIVNAITVYRLVAAFLLLYLIVNADIELFRWLLLVSFFTDAIDGFLARKYGVVSVAGSRLDSVADDLTVLMAIIGMIVFETGFLWDQLPLIFLLTGLYLLQLVMAFIRYGKLSSFHTFLAKIAAVLQGVFLVLLFFLPEWPVALFHLAALFTILDLTEEILLVLLLPRWQSNVKGLYWVWKENRKHAFHPDEKE